MTESLQIIIRDLPLFGTSLAAVQPRKGILLDETTNLPVVYLQWDDLALVRSQGKGMHLIYFIYFTANKSL